MSIEDIIKHKIQENLKPLLFVLENESAKHAGHAGDNGTGQSHFHLKIVSEKFLGLGRIERHRLVNDILSEELSGPVHALSLKTYAPNEVE